VAHEVGYLYGGLSGCFYGCDAVWSLPFFGQNPQVPQRWPVSGKGAARCGERRFSGGGSTFAGQYVIFVERAPVTQSWTTSSTANLRLGPSTAGRPQGTVSAGQSLTLICYDPNGESISGYATWDQLSSGLWVYDDLMNTPPGGPTGLPQCANYPPNL
jgi:hypothetical protein